MKSLAELMLEDATRVFEAERASNTRRLAVARVVVAALGCALALSDGSPPVTVTGVVVYLAIGLVLFAAASRQPRPWIPWAIPLLDVPVVAATQLLRLAEGGVSTHAITLTALALALGFIALSALTLSPPIVLATACMAISAFVLVSVRAGLPLVDLDFASLAMLAAAALLWLLTRRMLPLALEIRRRDWAGRYRIGPRLGAGGMAEVFEATLHRPQGAPQRVALKRMLPALAAREDIQRLFLRELELASLMAHPNIVQVLDTGVDDAGPFLVMEYVDGRPLSRVLQAARERHEPLGADACLTLAVDLLRALEHVHGRRDASGHPLGLMHRDLNPPNVLITHSGEAKVSDFGVARGVEMEGETRSDELRGKLSYAAPEQLRGEPLTPALDLFALGIVLAEAALGAYPFHGHTPEECLLAQLAGQASDLHLARPDLPAPYLALVADLLRPSLDERCPSAATALERLQGTRWSVSLGREQLARLTRAEPAGEQTAPG